MPSVEFEGIYLNQSKSQGRMRIADSGLGWKAIISKNNPSTNNPPFLLPKENVLTASWSRGARGWELRFQTGSDGVIMLDGFDQQDFNKLKIELQRNFDVQLEHKEHSLRGWNWGKAALLRNELVFNVNNKPSFELPYSEISNSNLTGKNEVAIEFNLSTDKLQTRTGDELVEVRLYIPGNVEKENDANESENNENEGENTEEQSAASAFYEQLREKADIGQVAGDAIVSFSDILFLTPRGRYDIDMYPTSLRLRGKTYDYKIQYRQIQGIFTLPKPDEIHNIMVLQIDPPLRQGQTRYPFLIMQFMRDEVLTVELNVDDQEFNEKYKGKLEKSYDKNTHLVISHCFRGLTNNRIIVPGTFSSKLMQSAVSCSLKASEGHLYLLDKCFLFVTKPTVYIPFSEVSSVVMSRLGKSVSSSRTFDLEIDLRNSSIKHVFANISKEEQNFIENYLKEKNIRVKNDEKDGQDILNHALDFDEDQDMSSSDDEDFNADSESASDVAEEFDSDHHTSGSESEDNDSKRPKKKAKK
ncbi:FACT complex subunit POB3 [Ascoidea rubescens DSM 1968]|uniref:FACT complex subunit POB3 n=1 Tax=Ascoidea rubescens DSM 1968 TaxID=1344418 RepID=A0A1D2VPM7_9ASCO|nr:SSrecog-domain-containing protein [Ascoidea rubescens DSM 1968]ODV63573.1 SSrecog-domain-containing protein [Ascoidea rubescens DSM 1968]